MTLYFLREYQVYRPRLIALCIGLFAWGPMAAVQAGAVEQAKMTALDAADSDSFGSSISIDGDTAIVGAPVDDTAAGLNAGSAYVFVRSAGVWTQQQQLFASDAAAMDNFGYAVSISGDTAIVGAVFDDDAGTSSGSAYIFVRSAGVWTQAAKLTALDASNNDYFGFSVAIDGDTAIVGAPLDGAGDAGSAYIFVKPMGGWVTMTQTAKILPSDPADPNHFGESVAISGDTAVVGSPGSASFAGAAYIYWSDQNGNSDWNPGSLDQQTKLTACDGASSDSFGQSVSISGDRVLVGAYGDDHAGGTDAGSAYVFLRAGSLWSQAAKLVASDAAGFDNFGWSVSISGQTAVAGAPNAESAYLFAQSNGAWTQQNILTASDGTLGDLLGASVAIDGGTAVAGASLDDHGALTDAGAAYVFVFDEDSDGIPDGLDVCPNNSAGLPVDADGRPLRDCNQDCQLDGLDVQCIADEILNQ